MGWCSMNLNTRGSGIKKWFIDETPDKYEVLDIAIVQWTQLYAAIKVKATGEVFCATYMIQKRNGHHNFSYKSMTEHSGPFMYDCPNRIFKLLTPLNDENDPDGFAREWRAKVKKILDNRERLKVKGNILIKLDDEIKYNYGWAKMIKRVDGKYFAIREVKLDDYPGKVYYSEFAIRNPVNYLVYKCFTVETLSE